jgi:hypothetical protein
MTSWSYQSTNPCTVLVKEKQDGQSSSPRDCPPHILQSSTEKAAASLDLPEISSLGNSVGGKKGRGKRQAHEEGVVDVVFDNGDGHEEQEKPAELVEKRILVNISIAMDKGLGSPKLEVYQLQVAVPLPQEKIKQQQFYAYDVGDVGEGFIKVGPMDLLKEPTQSELESMDYSSSTFEALSSMDLADESSTIDFIEASKSPEGLSN